MELVLQICQTLSVSFLAAWLTLGVWDNIRHPSLNRDVVRDVLCMARLAEMYPDIYAQISYRTISRGWLVRLVFAGIVTLEATVVVALWVAAASLFGGADHALALAMLAVLGFTSIWALFLIAGNWFCYWCCHEGAQNTHYQMVLWGLATLVLLIVSGSQIPT